MFYPEGTIIMKKIAVIYEQRDNIGLARFVASTIEDVFRDYAFVENYFLNELPDNFKITADAHVLKDSSVITPARNHLNNFDTLVILQRTPCGNRRSRSQRHL